MNFRSVTHEQAAVEIAKPADTVSILAQYNVQSKYKESVDSRINSPDSINLASCIRVEFSFIYPS